MIFKKKKLPDLPRGLRDAPETLEYKQSISNQNMGQNEEDFNPDSELPKLRERQEDIGLPPLDRPVLEMPPQEEKKIRKFSKEKEIFVKMDNFKEIIQCIENIDKRLNELESLMGKLQKLNDAEVSEINSWKTSLDEVREEIKTIGENLSQ